MDARVSLNFPLRDAWLTWQSRLLIIGCKLNAVTSTADQRYTHEPIKQPPYWLKTTKYKSIFS